MVAWARGERERAARLLEDAAEGYENAEMVVHAAVCQRRLGCSRATQQYRQQAARNARMSARPHQSSNQPRGFASVSAFRASNKAASRCLSCGYLSATL